MKKSLFLAAAAALASAGMAQAEEVRVYNWSDYIDEALLDKFEAETGIDDLRRVRQQRSAGNQNAGRWVGL